MADGTAAIRLITAMSRNILCIASMNKSTFSAFAATGKPAKIAWSVVRGMVVAMITNAIPRLNRKPEVTMVEDIPAAIPLRSTGDAFIIEPMLGATNMPPPTPTKIIGKTRRLYETFAGSVENQTSATAEITSPPVLKTLAPCLSERYPLNGPTLTNAIENGISRIPAERASNSRAPWK